MNTLFKKIDTHALNALLKHKKIIVGLSGGPDSVFLLHYMVNLRTEHGIELIAAHLDHGWRKESPEDAQWCAQLCASLNVSIINAHAHEIPLSKPVSGELQGRLLRRTFFEKALQEQDATAIVLGHHADDVLETFFIRLARGASLSGLSSIALEEGSYIHPLINVRKNEILTWLEEHQQTYRVDATNDTDAYLRNKIRNNVIPLLNTLDERFSSNALKTIATLKEENELLIRYANDTLESLRHEKENYKYHLSHFLELPTTLQKRILIKLLVNHKISFTPTTGFLDELLRFLHTHNVGIHQIAHEGSIMKKSGYFWFEK